MKNLPDGCTDEMIDIEMDGLPDMDEEEEEFWDRADAAIDEMKESWYEN